MGIESMSSGALRTIGTCNRAERKYFGKRLKLSCSLMLKNHQSVFAHMQKMPKVVTYNFQ